MALIFNEESWQLVKTGETLGEWREEAPTETELMLLSKADLIVLMKRGAIQVEKARGIPKKFEDTNKEEMICALTTNWSKVYVDHEENTEPTEKSLMSMMKALTKAQLLGLVDALNIKTILTTEGKTTKPSIKSLNESLIAAIMKAPNSEQFVTEWLKNKEALDDKNKSKSSVSKWDVE